MTIACHIIRSRFSNDRHTTGFNNIFTQVADLLISDGRHPRRAQFDDPAHSMGNTYILMILLLRYNSDLDLS